MDWSLVLASQDIAASIERGGDRQWFLIVSAGDHERALQSIRQYRLENRGWRWRQAFFGQDLTWHWCGAVWCIVLAEMFILSTGEFSEIHQAWILHSAAARSGEWWRIFTALILHADLVHLLANLTTGGLLFGLAMGRYGSGCGSLACYLAGALGNVLGLIIHSKPYDGLGASGMVMAALGLIAAPGFSIWKAPLGAYRQAGKSVLAATLLFVLLGLNPASDVVAHFGGFAAGIVFGLLLNALPNGVLSQPVVGVGSWIALALLMLWTGWLGFWQK
ncbi:MAG: rhomboid family intramembrane serine protease [Verrucomicrobia bacterium]|nr:rhomboid family intramembrane serine protease [Verrucomicrobiota bacterium]